MKAGKIYDIIILLILFLLVFGIIIKASCCLLAVGVKNLADSLIQKIL